MLSIRKIGIIGRTYRHLTRYRQILTVFFKYGLGEFVDLLKIEKYIETGLQLISSRQREHTRSHTRAERVRLAFEELGPTFIKLGQVLSSQPGLIPIDIVSELSKLQDDVPPSGFEPIAEKIETELKAPVDSVFKNFDRRPLASASMAQVYKARLPEGQKVAVKIQRPGIQQTIEIDLEIMLYLAGVLERNIEEFATHRPVKIVEEFARVLERELDFTVEATNMERFSRQFADDPTIYVPTVYRQYTTSTIITLEHIEGIKISDMGRLEKEGYDKKEITRRGTDVTMKQVFIHGFFHADPHPGNLFVLPGNVICPIDFGMVGSVDLKHRELFVDLLDNLVNIRPSRAAQVLLQIAIWDDEPDVGSLERDLADFVNLYFYRPLKDLQIGDLLYSLLDMLTRHRLRMPPNVFLMIKAISTVEGIARRLDPEFDIITHATPFMKKVKLARFSPGRVAGEIISTAADLGHFARQFPDDLLDISRRLKDGKITINVEHKGFENLTTTHAQVSNRLSFSIIIAALLIGSAMIIIAKVPPLMFGFSMFGLIGFTGAAVLGVWLMVAILRKGRL
ncbi:MAG: AarF/ABC1/UbiB kinase family protein [Desulfosudaceae bacterium]